MMHRQQNNNNTLLGDVSSNNGMMMMSNVTNNFKTPTRNTTTTTCFGGGSSQQQQQGQSTAGGRTQSFALPTPNSQQRGSGGGQQLGIPLPQSGKKIVAGGFSSSSSSNNRMMNSANNTPKTAPHNNNNNSITRSSFKTTSTKALQQQQQQQQQIRQEDAQQQRQVHQQEQQQALFSPSKCLFHNMSSEDFRNQKNLIGHPNRMAACYYTPWSVQQKNSGENGIQYLLPPLCPNSPHLHPVITVVLDLDETLVNNRCPDRPTALLRPHVIHFLDYVRTRHAGLELVLWTASTDDTARPVIRQLSADNNSGVCPFDHVICRNDIWFTPGPIHTKDLRLLGRNMDRVVVVDNSAQCVKFNPHNAILVQDFVKQRPAEDETLVCTGKIITHLHGNLCNGKNIPVQETLRALAEESSLCNYHQLFLNEAWGALESMDHIDPIMIPPHGHYIKSGMIFPRNNNNNNNNHVVVQQPAQQQQRAPSVSLVDTNRNITIKNRRRSCNNNNHNYNNNNSSTNNNNSNSDGIRCGEDSIERDRQQQYDEQEENTNNNNNNVIIATSQEDAASPSQEERNNAHRNIIEGKENDNNGDASFDSVESFCGEDSQHGIAH